jgi:hypothetical protein
MRVMTKVASMFFQVFVDGIVLIVIFVMCIAYFIGRFIYFGDA